MNSRTRLLVAYALCPLFGAALVALPVAATGGLEGFLFYVAIVGIVTYAVTVCFGTLILYWLVYRGVTHAWPYIATGAVVGASILLLIPFLWPFGALSGGATGFAFWLIGVRGNSVVRKQKRELTAIEAVELVRERRRSAGRIGIAVASVLVGTILGPVLLVGYCVVSEEVFGMICGDEVSDWLVFFWPVGIATSWWLLSRLFRVK